MNANRLDNKNFYEAQRFLRTWKRAQLSVVLYLLSILRIPWPSAERVKAGKGIPLLRKTSRSHSSLPGDFDGLFALERAQEIPKASMVS